MADRQKFVILCRWTAQTKSVRENNLRRSPVLCAGISPLSSPFASKNRRCSMLAGVQVCCVPRALRIIDGREQECSPSAALSLYPEGPRVLFRISSSGPCERAVVLQEVSILELLRQLAA